MGRKYKQPGYQSDDREKERKQRQQQPKRGRGEGPRSPRMPGFQELMRCAMCGNIIPASLEIISDSKCPKCEADLRSCKHCQHFDTAARLECTQPVQERIMVKDVRNDCEFFEPRTSIERETSSPNGGGVSPSTPRDARSAFDDLFR
jgi:hypothetical protein